MKDTIERLAVTAATIAMLAVNAMANTVGIDGERTGEVAARYDLPFAPAGWVFGIWSVIYLGLIAYAGWQWTARGARSARTAATRPAFVFTAVANIAWLVFWHHEALIGTLAVMSLLLGGLVAIYRSLGNPGPASLAEAWYVDATFSLYAGWITIATLANLGVVVVAADVFGVGLDPVRWSQAMLVMALAIGAFVYLRLGDLIFLGVITWATVGIALKGGQAPAVAATALAVAGLTGFGVIRLLLQREPPAEA